MALKLAGYYQDETLVGNKETDQLVFVISQDELVCMVQQDQPFSIDGFEQFQLPEGQSDWSHVFHELLPESHILNRAYRHTHCWFHTPEAIVIPADLFTTAAAEDYLNLVYGESDRHSVKYEKVSDTIGVAYRIRKNIHDMIARHSVLYQPHHLYTTLLQEVLQEEGKAEDYLKAQVFQQALVAVLVKNNQLQLIQSFHCTGSEDLLYHLVHLSQQFGFDVARSHLDISGCLLPGSVLHQQLQPLFGLISFDSMEAAGVFQTGTGKPPHYFTPYQKLRV